MSSDFVKKKKKEKRKKRIFEVIRGEQGGRRVIEASWWIVYACKANLFLTPLLFWELILVLKFPKNNSGRIYNTDKSNSSTENEFGGREDMWLTLRTSCRHMNEKMHKIWPAIQFCPWDFRTCPCPKNMSRTFTGHFQLRVQLSFYSSKEIFRDLLEDHLITF